MAGMCGRFAVTTDPALLAQKIRAIDESMTAGGQGPNHPVANYNVAPTTSISTLVTRHGEPDDEPTRRVRSMRWGLVPHWSKTAEDGGPDAKGPLLINARAETVSASPAFRNAAKHKRCLVPMDGWYEWRPGDERAAGKKAPKTPFYMYADDGELLFMAGLWSTWRPKGAPPDAAPLLSCAIVTTEAVGPLAEVHDRMPLTVGAADWDRWLDPDAPIDEGLLHGHGDLNRIVIRRVSTLVNNIRNNGPELIEPDVPRPEQAGLF
jgi:putative SOS response-associated peptidase YedK